MGFGTRHPTTLPRNPEHLAECSSTSNHAAAQASTSCRVFQDIQPRCRAGQHIRPAEMEFAKVICNPSHNLQKSGRGAICKEMYELLEIPRKFQSERSDPQHNNQTGAGAHRIFAENIAIIANLKLGASKDGCEAPSFFFHKTL